MWTSNARGRFVLELVRHYMNVQAKEQMSAFQYVAIWQQCFYCSNSRPELSSCAGNIAGQRRPSIDRKPHVGQIEPRRPALILDAEFQDFGVLQFECGEGNLVAAPVTDSRAFRRLSEGGNIVDAAVRLILRREDIHCPACARDRRLERKNHEFVRCYVKAVGGPELAGGRHIGLPAAGAA